jgi:integrase
MHTNAESRSRRPQTSGRNEGSVWFREARAVWVAEVSLPSGRRRTVQRRTRPEARKALKVLLATIKAPPGLPPNCSLGKFLPVWLDRTAKDRDPKTNAGYHGIMLNHVIPMLGKVHMDDLSVTQLEWYYAEVGKTLSAQTVKNHRMALQSAFTDAERWSVIPIGANPARISKTPSVPEIPRTHLSVTQIKQFLQDPDPDRLHALFVLDLCAGARESELLGLTWPDIDGTTMHLNFQLARQYGAWVRKPLKGGRIRQVELPQAAVDALQRHREQQLAERAALGQTEPYDGLVFTSASGAPLHANPVLAGWYAALERVGLPRVTFHDGRHSYNSALMHLGVDWRVSADQTGHSTAAMQKHYSHGTPESRRKAAATLQAGLDAAGRPTDSAHQGR